MSPLQLFVSKSMELARSSYTGIRDLGAEVPSSNDVMNVGSNRQSARRPGVNVPTIPCPINDGDLAECSGPTQ